MDNKMRNTLLGSLAVLAGFVHCSSINAAQTAHHTQIAQTSQAFASAIPLYTAQTDDTILANGAFASPPIGFISEGLGEDIAIAETEIVLANQVKPRINRAVFTHGINQHEPIDTIVSISQSYGKMYFFTEFINFNGELIKHRWEHEGEIKAEVEFEVGSPRWRAYSSKNITNDALGTWKVFVTDSEGTELFSNSIIVVN